MHKPSYYIINSITIYRLVASLLLLYLIYIDAPEIFKWLLAFSFFTDSIDGFLARSYKVASVFGSKIDSLADDLTVLVGVVALFEWRPGFIRQELTLIIILCALFLAQITLALLRYGRVTNFHTYLAKIATLFQGMFLIFMFFLSEWPLLLFYIAATITILELIEEIIIVLILPQWKTDVKGLYWIYREKRSKRNNEHSVNYK